MRRVNVIERGGQRFWVAAERSGDCRIRRRSFATVRGWMESTGPMTVTSLANRLALPRDVVESAMAKLEASRPGAARPIYAGFEDAGQ